MRTALVLFPFIAALQAAMGETLPVTQPPPLAALPQKASTLASPEEVELGRLLFFDPILSPSKTISCATCHQPDKGWTDGRETSVGLEPLRRNSLTILNVAFNAEEVMFWDNRERGLSAQVLHPLRSAAEMKGPTVSEPGVMPLLVERVSQIEEYRRRFGGTITPKRITDAIAAFERTLITPDTRFDRYMRGDKQALNAAEQRGLEVFESAGCRHCHSGPMLSDFKLHVIGAPGERAAFRTPSLRNLAHTAPYMHNGQTRTLDDVLLFYEEVMDEVSETLEGADSTLQPPLDPLLRHLNLRAEDMADLKTFLLTLSADHYDQSKPDKVPSGLPMR